MLAQVLPNKYAAKVYEGDVEDTEIGFHRKMLEKVSFQEDDEVIVYSFGERKPYFLRKKCYVVEVKKNVHSSFKKAEHGYAVLSPESMAQLNLSLKGDVIIDPVILKEDLAILFERAKEFLI